MDTCVACGAELGVGRFCLNCGHRIGTPAPARREPAAAPAPPLATATALHPPPTPVEEPAAETSGVETDSPAVSQAIAHEASHDPSPDAAPAPGDPAPDPAPVVPPVQAADPTPVPPTSPPVATSHEPAPAPSRRTTWDPREDLLPYEEVDDLDGDLPVRGKAWIGWVVGAALLVGLVFLLLRVFDTDGDELATDPADGATGTSQPQDPGAEPSAGGDDAQGGAGKARELIRGATFEVPGTAPPTTDFDGNLAAYEASQMGDGNPATAWRTAGDASGETVTVTLARPGVVTRVGLVNGYAKKVAGVNWYPNNRRILAVTWGFDDGSSVEQGFAERPGMQRRNVPPVETSTITITFTAVTPPGTGNLGRDYTAISEVSIMGRRAG